MRFTIEPGFAASFALHGAILLIAAWVAASAPKTLVVVFEGMEADYQVDEKLKEQSSGSPGSSAVTPQQQTLVQAGENRQTDATSNEAEENSNTDTTPNEAEPIPSAGQPQAAPTNAAPSSPGSLEVSGDDQRQDARKIRPRVENRIDPLQAYAKLLTKKVQSELVYPEAGRQAGLQGAAVVSFTILPDGALSPGSLRIVSSSGEAKLDESALKTIRACAPFDPPPHKITLKITIKYGRRR
ncbi:energy transducer TonB [Methylocapsa polymorpha]|uniref:Energy transducer TonB n=1 Tax=Methylocapsa polymorpha TaxID=3080828 RepID=A0ABZ0HSS7_9HYPH|nr:energy transducer TonB [Methylocapsa sp. RX1]